MTRPVNWKNSRPDLFLSTDYRICLILSKQLQTVADVWVPPRLPFFRNHKAFAAQKVCALSLVQSVDAYLDDTPRQIINF